MITTTIWEKVKSFSKENGEDEPFIDEGEFQLINITVLMREDIFNGLPFLN